MVFQAIEFQLRYTLRHSRNIDGGVFALGIQIAAPLSQFAPILPGRKLRAFFCGIHSHLRLRRWSAGNSCQADTSYVCSSISQFGPSYCWFLPDLNKLTAFASGDQERDDKIAVSHPGGTVYPAANRL